MNYQHIGLSEFCAISGLTRKTIYNREKMDRHFPQRVEILPTRKLPIYLKSEVEQWSLEYAKKQKPGRPKNGDNQNSQIIEDLLEKLNFDIYNNPNRTNFNA